VQKKISKKGRWCVTYWRSTLMASKEYTCCHTYLHQWHQGLELLNLLPQRVSIGSHLLKATCSEDLHSQNMTPARVPYLHSGLNPC
jgi:hypothetical protein